MPSASEPLAELCPQCGKKPGKPKFCSQSCAAKFNNRQKPKRKPEGKCVDCGAAVLTVKKRCDACKAKAAEAKRRADENIQTFRTPTGELRELAIPKAWVHAAMVFEPKPHGGRLFGLTDRCGEILDALLGVVFARPAYIRPDDILRYASWVDYFSTHVIENSWETRQDFRGPVTSMPLHNLGYALNS